MKTLHEKRENNMIVKNQLILTYIYFSQLSFRLIRHNIWMDQTVELDAEAGGANQILRTDFCFAQSMLNIFEKKWSTEPRMHRYGDF